MNSCLYRCRVAHKRERPKQHRFAYSTFVFCIDLDELQTLENSLKLFGLNALNLYALHDRDHLDQGEASIKENVVAFLRTKGMNAAIGRIELVTNLRTWGYVFNPVSFYFVYSPEGSLLSCVAEVANTFNEQKLYLVDQFTNKENRLKQSHEKLFYISPFSDLDTKLNFDLQKPSERLKLSITENDTQGTFFFSSLTGVRIPITNTKLLAYTLRFPFLTLGVMFSIHWQALILSLKKVPHFKKSHRPDQQTETRPYLKPKPKHSQ
ncbi:DUF1365 domain-containing protein [Pelagicoccus sp. SDUM812002]|uniref:DUF1365 domain-containing protein n=1 Tax=Pelagicoccus sp. SDUM812002 TaxID=3041266 RepID=UPI00280DB966|nr:DUF1365 domain-containing protein [Pelagicoccus sp. SDUM812002]MDQ8185047.1 DUF1365 domain-containing protein [Pelagicoccus sp. SDUM812002]